MRSKALSVLIALALLLPPAARAFEVPARPGTLDALMRCSDRDTDKLYNAQSRDAPAPIAASFAGHGAKLAFRTCRDADGNIHYFIREHRPNRNGVCRSFEREVYPRPAADRLFVTRLYDGNDFYFMLPGWSRIPPPRWDALRYPGRSRDFGFTTTDDCPPGDDPRYIPMTNVTDGTLKAFEETWRRIAASPESLQAAIAKLPVHNAAPLPRLDTPERREAFRARIVPAVFKEGARPSQYSCDSGGCAVYFGHHFELRFDMGPEGIVLASLHAVLRA